MSSGRYAALLEPSKSPANKADTPLSPEINESPTLEPQTNNTRTVQSTAQSTRQFTRQSIKQSTELNDNDVVNKPKGFYITNRLDKRINNAVNYLQEKHGIRKVDRSLIINAMLDIDDKWTDDALDKLVAPIISILTDRLLK